MVKKKPQLNRVNSSEVKLNNVNTSTDNKYKLKAFDWAVNSKYLFRDKNSELSFFKYFEVSDETYYTDKLKDIIKKFESLRSWKWMDIERSYNGTSNGYMPIHKLEQYIQKLVNEHIKNIKKSFDIEFEDDVLYKIEIDGSHRVWGIRKHDTFFPIWNDKEHKFYKPQPKNYIKK